MSKALVIDNGSFNMRAGISGDSAPKATTRSDSLGVSPIERGVITNWDAMEQVWGNIYNNELKIQPSAQPVLLTESPTADKKAREHAAKIMFEKFKVPDFYMVNTAVLGLYSTGKKTGLCLEIGGGVAHASPIVNGYIIPDKVTKANLAGCDITKFMKDSLAGKGIDVTEDIARKIKEDVCFVRATSEPGPVPPKDFTLPNGQIISVGQERANCPEALFQPSLIGSKEQNIAQLVVNAIEACTDGNEKLKRVLYTNIVLMGGSTLFEGLEDRVKREVKALAPPNAEVMVTAHDYRAYGTWIGGSILASLEDFKPMLIRREDYQKQGASVFK